MKELTNTSKISDALAFRIYRLQRLLRLDLVRFLEEHESGLTPEYYFLLFRLKEADGVRQQALVDPAIGDRPNISRHIAGLERLGLVARRPDPDDGRAQRVHLTQVGSRLIEGLMAPIVEERKRLFGDIDSEDLEAMSRVMRQLEATLTV